MSNLRRTTETNSPNAVVYPFSAIVGQEEMKLALILSVIDPTLGGVLIMGHRGTGKSTAVRGLAELLPTIKTVAGCTYRCNPDIVEDLCSQCAAAREAGRKLVGEKSRVRVVDLPLGATEDRVCGSIDIESALKEGTRRFEPGLLAYANRGFLYIDEVNLLEDHLVDVLLDVSVSGRNRVERENISFEHPARFVLIGSGNPEEGELRPQLLDRFGLHVEVTTENELEQRVEIVERRELFESNRERFMSLFAGSQEELRKRIVRAQKVFPKVKISRELLRKIAELASRLKLDGHRGELTLTRASRALAAFENRLNVRESDITQIALISLRHRLRREAFDETGGDQKINEALAQVFGQIPSGAGRGRGSGGDQSGTNGGSKKKPASAEAPVNKAHGAGQSTSISPQGKLGGGSSEWPFNFHGPELSNELELPNDPSRRWIRDLHRASSGKKGSASKQVLNRERGRYANAIRDRFDGARVAVDATIRAAACLVHNGSQSLVPTDALRYKQFRRKQGSLFILAIDTSGSMAAKRIERAREVALSLLRRSYIRRERIAIVVFRGRTSEVVLPVSRSMLRARRALDSLAVGGGTPLSAGVSTAIEVAKLDQSNGSAPVILLFTDGGANVPSTNESLDRNEREVAINAELASLGVKLRQAGITTFLVDTQDRFSARNDTQAIAMKLGARLMLS